MSEVEAEVVTLRQVIDPYDASESSNTMIEAAAAEAFRRDDLGGHVAGPWEWESLPADGRRNYRALVVAVLNAAIAETDARAAVMCACGHGLHVHDPEADPYLCEVCGENTNCDYASREEIAADRWDEGWIAAVTACTPDDLHGTERVLFAVDHMPAGNPYRPIADEPAADHNRADQ